MNDTTRGAGFVVLGASGAIGSALARRLRSSGAQVLLCGRDEGRLATLAEELDAPSATFDARDSASVEACFDRATETFGALRGAACCVGSILLKPAHLTADAQWHETVSLNLDVAFFCLRAAVARMQRSGGGSVVLCSSAAARQGLANHEAIAAAKAGIEGMVRAAAATYGPRKIRVNAVAPGLVDTPLAAAIVGNAAARAASEKMHPLGRIGAADEVAAAIAWLLSDEAAWITGQSLGVDGGLGVARAR